MGYAARIEGRKDDGCGEKQSYDGTGYHDRGVRPGHSQSWLVESMGKW